MNTAFCINLNTYLKNKQNPWATSFSVYKIVGVLALLLNIILVLATSRGVVTAAEKAPANDPQAAPANGVHFSLPCTQ